MRSTTVDAGDHPRHEFDVTVTVPGDARLGRAGIVAQSIHGPSPADFTVVRRSGFARTGVGPELTGVGLWLVATGLLLAVSARPFSLRRRRVHTTSNLA